jgi:hypothetical protein
VVSWLVVGGGGGLGDENDGRRSRIIGPYSGAGRMNFLYHFVSLRRELRFKKKEAKTTPGFI